MTDPFLLLRFLSREKREKTLQQTLPIHVTYGCRNYRFRNSGATVIHYLGTPTATAEKAPEQRRLCLLGARYSAAAAAPVVERRLRKTADCVGTRTPPDPTPWSPPAILVSPLPVF